MQVVQPLNAKQLRTFFDFLQNQYGFEEELEYSFFIQTRTRKILMLTNQAAKARLDLVRVNSQGLYVAEVNEAWTNFRLSIDMTQIVGAKAKQNIVTLSDSEFDLWVRGNPLELSDDLNTRVESTQGYVIVKNNSDDYYGVGNAKDGELMNFTPKARRVQSKLE